MRPTFGNSRTRYRGSPLIVSIAACVGLASWGDVGVTAQGRTAPGRRPRPATPALTPAPSPTAYVHSTPENVVLGTFPIDRPPVVKVASGSVVRVDTLSQRGTTQQEDPVAFLGKLGVKPDEILQDVRDVWAARAARPQDGHGGGGGHILTGSDLRGRRGAGRYAGRRDARADHARAVRDQRHQLHARASSRRHTARRRAIPCRRFLPGQSI